MLSMAMVLFVFLMEMSTKDSGKKGYFMAKENMYIATVHILKEFSTTVSAMAVEYLRNPMVLFIPAITCLGKCKATER
jgi:hypothetical protein